MPQAELPFATGVLASRLANGLTYYVRSNKEPNSRVELRLAVRVGERPTLQVAEPSVPHAAVVPWPCLSTQCGGLCRAPLAGSLSEQEHERGIAHVVEHLAFRATQNYGAVQESVAEPVSQTSPA